MKQMFQSLRPAAVSIVYLSAAHPIGKAQSVMCNSQIIGAFYVQLKSVLRCFYSRI